MGCGADSIKAWQQAIPELRRKLSSDDNLFNEVYKFSFDFTQDPGYKNISFDYASALWEILLGSRCNFLKEWLEFLEVKKTEIVKKDQWEQFYLLVRETKGKYSNFVDDGTWSSTVDEFNEFMQAKQ